MSEQVKKEEITETKKVVNVANERIHPEAVLRVKSTSNPKALAGSITATMKDYGHASLRCIGDGAIGRGTKAAAIASGFLKPIGVSIRLNPYFFETEIDGEPRTGIAIDIEPE